MSRRLVPLRLYYLTSFAALGTYLPYFPRWLAARGIDGFGLGAIAATLPAMGLLGPPIIGLVADALGLRGFVLRVACSGAFVAFATIALTGAAGHPLAFDGLFAVALIHAAFRSPMVMMADVVALELAEAEGRSYGGIRLWGSAGFLLAALAAGRWLDARALVPIPAAIAAALLLALSAAWTLPARSGPPARPVFAGARELLAGRGFPLFLGAAFLGQIAHSSYDLCFSLHLADLGAGDQLIGVAWATGVLVEIGLMASARPLLARFAPENLCVIALLGAAARWALLATVRSLPVLVALQPLHALSFALWWLAALAYIKRSAPIQAMATAQGLFSASTAAGGVLGMLLWGTIFRRAGGATTYGAAALVSIGAAMMALVWRRTLAEKP